MRLGLPAYFYPWPGSAPWRAVTSMPTGSVLVVDPANGPGTAADARYLDVLARTRSTTAARILGYVDSDYGQRPVDDVLTDADRFRTWYAVDGVFLDRVLPMAEQVPHYESVTDALRSAGLAVVLNSGQPQVHPRFLELADHVVVFEGGREHYLASEVPPLPGGRTLASSWHLVYDVPNEEAMREVVALARSRGADLLFVTDGSLPNPWDRLPAYWSELVALLAGPD